MHTQYKYLNNNKKMNKENDMDINNNDNMNKDNNLDINNVDINLDIDV